MSIHTVSDEIRLDVQDRLTRLQRQLEEETGSPKQRLSPPEWQNEVRGLAAALYALGDPIEELQPVGASYDPLGHSAGDLKGRAVGLIQTLRQQGKLPLPRDGRGARLDESFAAPR